MIRQIQRPNISAFVRLDQRIITLGLEVQSHSKTQQEDTTFVCVAYHIVLESQKFLNSWEAFAFTKRTSASCMTVKANLLVKSTFALIVNQINLRLLAIIWVPWKTDTLKFLKQMRMSSTMQSFLSFQISVTPAADLRPT